MKKIKKIALNEDEEKFPVLLEEISSLTFKPINTGNGYQIKETLQYLMRIIPQNDENWKIIFSLASFATFYFLSPKQECMARGLIFYYISKGVL